MQPLRDYQQRAVDAVRALWAGGRRRVLLVAPTGAGKSVMGLALVAPFQRALWLAHRRELVADAARRLRDELGACDVGLIAAGHPPSPYAPFQVSSVQTLVRRLDAMPPADAVAFDECFPGYVRIDGRRIDSMRVGDEVTSVDHATGEPRTARVARVMRREASVIVTVSLANRRLECTGNHPLFVKDKGYVEAKNVADGDLLCVQRPVSDVRSGENVWRRVSQTDLIGDYGAHKSHSRARAYDGAQPDSTSERTRENQQNAQGERQPADTTRRQWPGPHLGGISSCRGDGLATERDSSDGEGLTQAEASHAFQDRLRQPGAEDSDRSGWGESQFTGAEGSGSREGGLLVWERVESVTHQEFGRAVPVWNLEIEGSHTYFADGILVHNCHHAKADEWEQILKAYPDANHLLLTATPERQDGKTMADVADAIVVAADYSELLQAGHLCAVRVFRPDQILGNGLAMNPAEAWKRYSEGSPGFAFFGTVDQAYQYEHEMNALGIRAAVIEQGTEPVKRSGYIEAMRAGELDCICNVQTMTEGVDIPRARVCMLASACRHCGGYLQKAGRVLRPHASKPNAILIDLVGASILHGLPTENRTYSLDGDPIRRTDVIPTRQCQKCAAIVHASYKACPECSFPFGILGPKGKTEVKIHSLELIEVYAGKDTPVDAKRAEYRRLREIQRINKYPLYWIQSEYRKLFAEDVIISDATNSEKRIEHEKLIAIQRRSGAKPGMVFIRFKNLFGHAPPSHKRVGM